MHAPITVNYTPDGDDWTVTVAVAGEATSRSARARRVSLRRYRIQLAPAILVEDLEGVNHRVAIDRPEPEV